MPGHPSGGRAPAFLSRVSGSGYRAGDGDQRAVGRREGTIAVGDWVPDLAGEEAELEGRERRPCADKKTSTTKTDDIRNFRYAFFKPAESRGL